MRQARTGGSGIEPWQEFDAKCPGKLVVTRLELKCC